MKWLGRMLWLLLGLLWRLVVLLLFEKWVPFPAQEQAAPAAPRAARKKKRARDDVRPAGAAKPAAPKKYAAPSPFFTAQSSELSPELAAQREGEHWLKPRGLRTSLPAREMRENLGALLRDRRALRDAMVLGAALGARRRPGP